MILKTLTQIFSGYDLTSVRGGTFAAGLRRDSFARYFNWNAYDPDTETYHLHDGAIGALWECSPLVFASTETMTRLEGLFRLDLPHHTAIQFLLHADPYLEPHFAAFRTLRTLDNPLIQRGAEETLAFLRGGIDGFPQIQGIPLRNFRLFVSVKLPSHDFDSDREGWELLRQNIKEMLGSAHLRPRAMTPDVFLAWMRTLLNAPIAPAALHTYDPDRPINQQVLRADSAVTTHTNALQVGEKHFRAVTPKNLAMEGNPLQACVLSGGIQGIQDDTAQFTSPFLWSVTYVVDHGLGARLSRKCNIVLAQKSLKSFARSLERKQEEFKTCTDALDRNIPHVYAIPAVWVYANSAQKASQAAVRAANIWENQGFLMQQERYITQLLFFLSLPFGFVSEKNLIELLDRHFILDAPAAARLLPIQADFAGAGAPYLVYIGRKGQIITIDLFDKDSTSHNFIVAATTGAGKSFFANDLCAAYRGAGGIVRIIDFGDSYRKMTHMLNARYLEFSPGTKTVLNPFSTVYLDGDSPAELATALQPTKAVVGQMATAGTPDYTLDQDQRGLLSEAVTWAWAQRGPDAGTDEVYSYLNEFPNHAGQDFGPLAANPAFQQKAHSLALWMRPFTSHGSFGHFFNGRATFDINSDDFVVLELKELKRNPDLFRVVSLQIINAVAADLYSSDPERRERRKIILIDEAWQFLQEGGGSEHMIDVVEGAYRMARKFVGAIGTVTQSVNDLANFGRLGKVIWGNAPYKFLLQSEDLRRAAQDGFLDYDDFTLDLVATTTSNRPHYSELFFDTPRGRGHGRFAVPRFCYFMNTSDGTEVAAIERMVQKEGKSYEQAIEAMLRSGHT